MVHNTTASMSAGTATTLPGAPVGYLWRPAQLEDAATIYELRIAADEADATDVAGSLDEAKRDFADSWTNSTTHSLLGFDRTGELIASARIFINPEATDEYRIHLIGEIHPRQRNRGLGQFLFSWMSDRAKHILSDKGADMKKMLFTYCTDSQSDRMELYEKNDFKIVRYFYRMRRDLHAPLSTLKLPTGITLLPWHTDRNEAARQIFNETFADHWNFDPVNEADRELLIVGSKSFQPDLSFLAWAGAEIVGICICKIQTEENEREGVAEGWVEIVGVQRAWRHKGIASALICQAMRAFRDAGMEFAGLGVDAENTTGALGIYEQ